MRLPKIDLVFRDATNACSVGAAFFARVFAGTLSAMRTQHHRGAGRAPIYSNEVSVSIVSERTIRGLNKRFRNRNKATDVLSFPVGVQYGSGYTIMALGDIFLCLAEARRGARMEGVSVKQKLAQLAVHGFLHLCGYDHGSHASAMSMERLERRAMSRLRPDGPPIKGI